jgi:acetolactate synthase-1/2/3 large subunit
MDSAPIVAITGQVPRPVIGNDAFQEADVTGITMPITKWNTLVMHAHDIPRAVHEAFYLARTGRPGPVLVDIPRDVSQEMCTPEFPDEVRSGYRNTRRPNQVSWPRAWRQPSARSSMRAVASSPPTRRPNSPP